MDSATGSSDPRATILTFFDELNAGDYEAAFARLAPDVAYGIIAPPPYGATVDREGLKQKAQQVFDCLAEPLQTSVGTILADGEYVVVEMTSHAPTKNGGSYDNRYLFIYRVIDGVIVEAREYLDSAVYLALVEGRI